MQRELVVRRCGSRKTARGSDAQFTGTVFQDNIVAPDATSNLRASLVTFEPGARTAWHSHPLGQVLYATHGAGRVQCKGGPVMELLPGDTAVIPPGAEHWHGAAPDRLFTHLAMSVVEQGGTAWGPHTSEQEYLREPQR